MNTYTKHIAIKSIVEEGYAFSHLIRRGNQYI